MTVAILVPALVAVVGVLVWALAANAKVSEIGKWMFVTGLLVTLLVVARNVVHL